MKTAFIGGGNMATALISGLAKTRAATASIRVSDPDPDARARLGRDFAIACTTSSAEAVQGAEVILLAVKPQVMPVVLKDLASTVQPGQLVISVAAGTRVDTIQSVLGADTLVVRAMPNTPALMGLGVTGLYAGPGCNQGHVAMAEDVMGAVGATVWVDDEALLDVVTAVSGSGPAYFFLLTEALREAGSRLGLPEQVSAYLALHTAHGAGVMVAESGVDASELRHRVTSPGGTTQAALETLHAGGFERLVADAVEAAARRGRELSETELDK